MIKYTAKPKSRIAQEALNFVSPISIGIMSPRNNKNAGKIITTYLFQMSSY
jgi:hypothetical protein